MNKRASFILCVFAVSCLRCSDTPVPIPKAPLKIGDLFMGGIVFYLDASGQHGLIAASSDLGAPPWGLNGRLISGASGSAIGTGKQNTMAIAYFEDFETIGSFCWYSYYKETSGTWIWYIPSKDELFQLYKSQYLMRTDNLDLKTGLYWTSTQYDADSAWSQPIDTYPLSDVTPVLAAPVRSSKSDAHMLRAIRSF